MNIATPKPTEPLLPVFPQTRHRLRPILKTETPQAKKRDNIFSKSRDIREDRGTREMKTIHREQTLPSGH